MYDAPLEKGGFRLGLDVSYRSLSEYVLDDGWVGNHLNFSDLSTLSPEAAEHGDGEIRAVRTDLNLSFAATAKTEISVIIPWISLNIRWSNDDEHHRNEVVDGLGNLRVAVRRYLSSGPKGQHVIFAGLSIPTAHRHPLDRTSFVEHEEADELGIEIENHTHQQIGSGTWDPFFGWEGVFRGKSKWFSLARFEATVPFDETSEGFRSGATFVLTGGPARAFPAKKAVLAFPWRFVYQKREHLNSPDLLTPTGLVLDGTIGVPNTGRFDAVFTPTASFGLGDHWSLRAGVEVPIHTSILQADDDAQVQFVEPFAVTFGFSWAK